MVFKGNKGSARRKDTSETARKYKTNPLLYIGSVFILVLVTVAFVGGDLLSGRMGGVGGDLTFGYYDKVPISYVPGNIFAQYLEMAANQRRNTMNEDNVSYMEYQIWRESFEAAAVHTAILQEMKIAGYSVPSKTVDREVASLPIFQENGRFSAALYRQMDENRRLSLWRQMQDDITRNLFRDDVTGLLKTEAEAEFIGRMASVERSFEMAVFSVDAFPNSEYEVYAQERSDLFQSVHLSMITISSSEREAQRIRSSIIDGETTFEDAAMAFSRDAYAERGGDMGVKLMHELDWDIPDQTVRFTITTLASGEFSDVLQSGDNWVFFRVEEAVQDADLSDEAVMDKVRSYLRNFERGRMEDWAIDQAEIFIALAEEIGFEAALSQQGMESRSFGPVPLNYGNVDLYATLASLSVAELSNSASDHNFWSVAFSTPVNTPSIPVVQGSNVLVIIPTDETEVDEFRTESIVSSVNSYWLDFITEQSMFQFFLNSPKMDDRFMDVYYRHFMGN
ncbi:MAG: SurA N-terminal domain-containing protein [Treponema sp.]|nr:SurA N-terminal domain-containing protein [Treponema sp.]